MRLFISYAREDRLHVRSLIDGLRALGHDAWLDESLAGGQEWWDAVLDEIRRCDVFLAVVSPASADSQACGTERQYAVGLKKTVLPVMLGHVAPEVLPQDLAVLQVIDYIEPSQEAAFRLARALANVKVSEVPPDLLPPAPPVPLSYLVDSLSASTRTR
jgi:TIR domain